MAEQEPLPGDDDMQLLKVQTTTPMMASCKQQLMNLIIINVPVITQCCNGQS